MYALRGVATDGDHHTVGCGADRRARQVDDVDAGMQAPEVGPGAQAVA